MTNGGGREHGKQTSEREDEERKQGNALGPLVRARSYFRLAVSHLQGAQPARGGGGGVDFLCGHAAPVLWVGRWVEPGFRCFLVRPREREGHGG